jgi:SAM-dependent methyltransferase
VPVSTKRFYARDLAHVHDAGFGDFARDAAPGLLRRLRRGGIRDGLVVDLGCGSGIWARALLDAGYDVLGVDVSADLLALARARAPGARFVRGSAYDVDLPPCTAVTALGEVLNYGAPPHALPRMFRRIHAALRPGGMFVFDLVGPGRAGARPRRTWHEGDGWLLCVETSEDRKRCELTRRITVFRRSGRSWRRSEEVHRLRLFDRETVLANLAAAGFMAEALGGYGRRPRFPAGWAGFVATPRPAPRARARRAGRA